MLRERCVDGITANPDRMRWFVEHSIGIVTALVPVLGYETATEIAREALATGRGVYELVMERELMTREELDRALNPETMTEPRSTPRFAPAAPPRNSVALRWPPDDDRGKRLNAAGIVPRQTSCNVDSDFSPARPVKDPSADKSHPI